MNVGPVILVIEAAGYTWVFSLFATAVFCIDSSWHCTIDVMSRPSRVTLIPLMLHQSNDLLRHHIETQDTGFLGASDRPECPGGRSVCDGPSWRSDVTRCTPSSRHVS